MKVSFEQLDGHLREQLAPVYLLSGDEPLLLGEAGDAVRAAARARGYEDRELLFTGRGFDWNELLASGASMSLFAQQRIIELRMLSAKPGKDGGAALVAYAQDPPPDTLLLISAPKLDRAAANAKWVKALGGAGALVQIWPVETARLPAWIGKRMRSRGLKPDKEAVGLIADRVEGNLLAASQEVDKLLLVHGPGAVTAQDVTRAVSDSARFDVFQLADAALEGDPGRALRVLHGLRSEGVEPPLILWALSRELRGLADVAWAFAQGESQNAAMRGVWPKRQGLIAGAARRLGLRGIHELIGQAGEADRVVKGQRAGRPWESLIGVVFDMANRQQATAS